MTHYAIRISREYIDISGTINKMSELSEMSVWYEHPADEDVSRTHVHGLLMSSSINTDSVKNWIKKELNLKTFDRSDWVFSTTYTSKKIKYSITMESYPKYITYMTKGIFQPKFNKGFDPEFLEQRRLLWVEPSMNDKYEKIGYKIIKPETPKEKKLREFELLELIDKRLKEKFTIWDDFKMIPVVIDVLLEQKHCLSVYKVRDWVEKVQMYGYKQSFVDKVRTYMAPRG